MMMLPSVLILIQALGQNGTGVEAAALVSLLMQPNTRLPPAAMPSFKTVRRC
jgi:hypothetical protein